MHVDAVRLVLRLEARRGERANRERGGTPGEQIAP